MSGSNHEIIFHGSPDSLRMYANSASLEKSKINIVELKEEVDAGESEQSMLAREKQDKLLSDLNVAFEGFFNGINLPAEEVRPENMHVIHEKKFENVKKRAGSHELLGAFVYNGEIYIKNGNPNDIMHDLSHAMMHTFSGSKKLVNVEAEEGTPYLFVSECNLKSGFELSNDKGKILGRGLNEAITEIGATMAKASYLDKIGQDASVIREINYLPQVFVLQDLAEIMNPENVEEAYAEFFKGYIDNSSRIWKLLSKTFKEHGIEDGLKSLLKMDLSVNSAIETAKKLGFTRALDKIKQIQKSGLKK